MKIVIVGDIHGNFMSLSEIVRNAFIGHRCDAAIQVGDFGFYPHMFKSLPKFYTDVYAIDGNHEKHEWLFEHKKIQRMWSNDKRLHFMPRQTIKEIDGATIGFFGGALNVDRPQYGSIDKRTTNYPLFDEAKEFAQKLNDLGKPIDLMVTHSAPCKIGVGMMGHPVFQQFIQEQIHDKMGMDTGPIEDCGEPSLKVLWEHLDHKPKHWVFGHFHQRTRSVVDGTTFWCVGSGDNSDNMDYALPFIYDTQKKELTLEDGFI